MANLVDTGVDITPKARLNYFKQRDEQLKKLVPEGVIPTVQQMEAASGVVNPTPSQTVSSQSVPAKTVPYYTGGSDNAEGAMDYLASLYTSPEEEEKLRRASIQNRRIMAVGDALRQIGNIYHTVNYAPSQTFNSPVENERKSYQQDRSIRDAANMRFLNYQQAKAAQDAKQRQWEATFNYNAARDAEKMELENKKYQLQRELNEARMNKEILAARKLEEQINEISELLEGKKAIQRATIGQKNASAASSMASAALTNERREHPERFRSGGSGGVGGYRTVTNIRYDNMGRRIGEDRTRTPNYQQSQGGSLLPGGNSNGGSLLPR